MLTADETARVLSHFRPGPEHVEVTRTAAVLCTGYVFSLQGPRAVRALVVLRRLSPAPPDTLIRAVAVVLRAAPEMDTATLTELRTSDKPLLAGVANGVASSLWESEGEAEAALKAAERMLEIFEHREFPWMRVLAHSRLGELYMHADQGAEALRQFRAALDVQEGLERWTDALGLRLATVLAAMQTGAYEEAERWLELARADLADETFGDRAFYLAVRGELLLVRGEVDAGLERWRRAVELMTGNSIPGVLVEPGRDPWVLELKTVAVVAHARHGRLDQVQDIVGELPGPVSALLADSGQQPVSLLSGFPLAGALLVALAMADLDRGARTGDEQVTRSAVSLVALAERFRYLRQFQPTMSATRLREAAERADREAYDDAVSSYASLDGDGLRAAALAAVSARDRG